MAEIPAPIDRTLTISGAEPLLLFGFNDVYLRKIEAAYAETRVVARGDRLKLHGPPDQVDHIERVVGELTLILNRNGNLTENDVDTVLDLARVGTSRRRSTGQDAILFTPQGGTIQAKTPGQNRLVEAARQSDILFAVGPAGTGKTYTAVALAVSALKSRQVKKIVLTRPAVEAGESLGFLPGGFKDKVDPYLRPLYDALEDMIERDKLASYLERNIVEIVPLAYMRGRAQPLGAGVLTPTGYVRMGDLEVGDSVVGSDGRPTRVEGVFPQGEREVYRVTTTDGASTLCSGDHLWSVTTCDDKRRGKPYRVLRTEDMVGRLRQNHSHRFELPLLSAPVAFESRPVDVDPYALGLLLGDGCLTGNGGLSFATADVELAEVLGTSLADVDVLHRGGPDYRISKVGGRATGNAPNPLRADLDDLGLIGTYSRSKFVPEAYLVNDADVRLGVLQGLLDSDGGPVTQEGRTCRIQYTTTSPRLRDDVQFLVWSLGGTAACRTREAEGRTPGLANGRPVPHRRDAFVLEIRLPEGIEPFRLGSKAEVYAENGGGRPQRYIASIEPVGSMPVQCISVGAGDSLYVTDGGILTHNTLNTAFVILDEAQNATAGQMKMFLTRIGAGSRAIVTGDATQTDLPSRATSGLVRARQILEGVDGIAFVDLDKGDVVRHKLVKDIIEAYEKAGD